MNDKELRGAPLKAAALALKVNGPPLHINKLAEGTRIRAILAYNAPDRKVSVRQKPGGGYIVRRVQ